MDGHGARPGVRDPWETVVWLAALMLIGVVLVAVSNWIPAPSWQTVTRSIGGGVLASAIFYVLVSIQLEPARQEAQLTRLIAHANDLLTGSFREHFSSIPAGTYLGSKHPSAQFSRDFDALLGTSRSFDFKGGSARYTAARMATASQPAWRNLDRIRLCLLDPRQENDTALRAFALQQLEQTGAVTGATRDEDVVQETVVSIRRDIYVTLVTLFDIRFKLATNVYFHRDLPFFRVEMFDDGMFLTHYRAGDEPYPTAFRYAKSSGTYDAYRLHMTLTGQHHYYGMWFSSGSARLKSDEDLGTALAELGCTDHLSRLRDDKEARLQGMRDQLRRSDPSPARPV